MRDRIQLTRQTAYDEVQKILAMLPDEAAKQLVLFALLIDRCRKCLVYAPTGSSGCCP